MDLEIEKFSPTKAELTRLVGEAQTLALPDQFDQAQLRRVKDARLNLRDARVAITKTGKTLREDALKFQKAVIAKEKELVAIIEPEENRLAELEDQAERAIERKVRMELLPQRQERLEAIGDGMTETDDHLLDMDDAEFEDYFNQRVADKNEADRQRIDAEKRAIDAEKAEIEREKEVRKREEKARAEERERLEREREEKEEQAKLQAKEERERLEREGRYQAFLKESGYTDETADDFVLQRSESELKLYKLVSVFKIK